MKIKTKFIFSGIAIAVALFVSFGLFGGSTGIPANAEQSDAREHSHCICGGTSNIGDHDSHSDVVYSAWNGGDFSYDGEDGNTGTAYLYLENDVVNNVVKNKKTCNRIDDDGILRIEVGQTLYLCLNGHSLKNALTSNNVIDCLGTLYLCDCTGGGTIGGRKSGANSGAIWLSGASLYMFGGTLTGSCGPKNGGGIYLVKSSATMYGGAIVGNTMTRRGGGVFVSDKESSFTMHGGTISNNNVSESGGGVIINGGTFTMNGGSITDNACGGYGGGVYLASGTFVMNDGVISGNTATNGGGVSVTTGGNGIGTFVMNDGVISGNTASNGGGVYAWDGSVFEMKKGTISENSATFGGGVTLFSANNKTGNRYNTLKLYSGEIKNNTASKYGSGVCCFEYSKLEFHNDGTIVIDENDNSNLYMADKCDLSISGIANGSKIGVSTITTPEKSKPTNVFESEIGDEYLGFFFSDNPDYMLIRDNKSTVLTADCYKSTIKYVTGCDQTIPDDVKTDLTNKTMNFVVTDVIPAATCRTFLGWATDANATSAQYKKGDALSLDGETTLFAVWKDSHSLSEVSRIDASSDHDGMKEHFSCSVCGKLFSDADAKTEVSADNLVIPALVSPAVTPSAKSGSLSNGAVAGITIGSLLGFEAIAYALFRLIKKTRA